MYGTSLCAAGRRYGLVVIIAAVASSACAGHSLYVRPGVSPQCPNCAAGPEQLDTRVLLVGDAGEFDPDNPALQVLANAAVGATDRSVALFLGDNAYPRGLPGANEAGVDAERTNSEKILQLQVEAAGHAGIPAVFVAGNHDWDKSGPRGLERLQAQEAFLAETTAADVVLHPTAGCPGPTVLDLGERVRLIVADSEWLLRAEHPKLTDCTWGAPGALLPLASHDAEGFYSALAEAVRSAGDRRILLATHHPLKTRGSHGGYFTAKEFFFPLTLAKSWLYLPIPGLYPLLRYGIVRSDQDLYGSRNREMVRRIEEVLATAASAAIAAAGHEHTLQVFDDPALPIWYLVSGSAAKLGATGKTDDTIFKHAAPGIMVVDFFVDGRVSVRVVEVDAAGVHEVFALWLGE